MYRLAKAELEELCLLGPCRSNPSHNTGGPIEPKKKAAAAVLKAPGTFSPPDDHRRLDDILEGEQQVDRCCAHHCLGQAVLQEGSIPSLHPQQPPSQLNGSAGHAVLGAVQLNTTAAHEAAHCQSIALTEACVQARAGQRRSPARGCMWQRACTGVHELACTSTHAQPGVESTSSGSPAGGP